MNIDFTNIDIIIFIVFLLFNLIVGLYYGRGVKNIKDYALGGRNFSTAALVSTITATWISGSGFFTTLSKTYSDGLYYTIASSGMAMSFLLAAFLVIPRMEEFLGKTSVAEAMGDLYGQKVRVITAIAGTLGAAGSVAVQFKAFGNIFDYFLGFPSEWAIITAGSIATIYSAFGGVKAVTFTDILQFITFGIGIPLVGIVIWQDVYNTGFSFTTALEHPNFDYKEVLNLDNPKFWDMTWLFLYFLLPSMGATFCQRIFMGNSIKQVQKAFAISAIFILLIKLIIAWIPFLIFSLNPDIEPNQLLNYIVDHYTYTGLKGIIIIGVTAMAMSSADSYINSSSILFANDLCQPLNISAKKKLLLSKMFSFILGVFAILLALSAKDLLKVIISAHSLYTPIVVGPLLMTIFGFRTTAKPVLIGMGAGALIVMYFGILDIDAGGVMLAMLGNIVFLIGSHYLLGQPGGWAGSQNIKYLQIAKRNRQIKTSKMIQSIKSFNFFEFCKRTAPTSDLTYIGLGIYCIFYTFTTMYTTHVELIKDGGKIILFIYQIMMVTGVIMAMYPIWPAKIKREIVAQVAWNIVIFYMLVFFSFFFVLVSNLGQLQFAVFTLNIVMTAILVGWKFGLGMILAGFYASFQFYKFYAGDNTALENSVSSLQFIFMYILMLIGSALIIFLKPKQEYQALTEEKNEHLTDRIGAQEEHTRKALGLKGEFIRNIQHEYHAPMVGISSMADSLLAAYDYLNDKERIKAITSILKSSTQLEVFDANISTLSDLSKGTYKLELEDINLSDLVYSSTETCRRLYENNKEDRDFTLNIEDDIVISGDRYYLTQVVDNLIINAITYCRQGKITITLKQGKDDEEKDIVTFTITDEGIGIPQDELFSIFDEFVVSSKTHTYAGGRGVGLALAKKVIEVHKGFIRAESDGVKGSRFTFMLPL